MLADFIAKTMVDQFEWGRNDCGLWCASAVEHETGVDPAAHVRGTYTNRVGYHRVIIQAGGLLPFASRIMDGAPVTSLDGDGVGVLVANGQRICGLIVDGRAVLRTETGLCFADDFEVLRGWSCLKP